MSQPTVFISYSHKDEEEKDKLLSHLGVLHQSGQIDLWSDDRIDPGEDKAKEINQAIKQAKVAILLITANFLSSAHVLQKEVLTLLTRHHREGLIIFPVIAKDCAWQTVDWLTPMSVRPKDGQPVWREQDPHVDKDLADIAREVSRINEQNVDAPKLLSFDDYSPPVHSSFVGREEELTQLNLVIQHSNIVVLGGITGIGKTYLAVEFAQRQKKTHPTIWLDCGSNVQLAQLLTGLAGHFANHFNDSSLLQVLCRPTATETQHIKSAVAMLNRFVCLFVWDGFDQSTHHSLVPLFEVCSHNLREGRLLITTQEWSDMDDLFNPPTCVPALSGLDKEASINLMQNLGLGDFPLEILSQAYHRIDGHPHFLRMLASLSKSFPLPALLNELPYIPIKIHKYLQQNVFDILEPDAKQLLQNLSLLRTPFQISAIKYLGQSLDNYPAFEILSKRFLVTLQSQENPYYEIHHLVRGVAKKQVSESDLLTIHGQIVHYYQALPQRRYLDGKETVYHALEADMLDEALKEATNLLGFALHDGFYDLVLENTSQLLEDNRTTQWWFIHYAQGRALRFKRMWSQSLKAYQSALASAKSILELETAKFEIASILIKRSEEQGGIEDKKTAKNYYTELLQSENLLTKCSALSVLGNLNVDDGHEEEGIHQIQESLSLVEQAGLYRGIAEDYCLLGRIYANRQDYEQAIQYLEHSLSIQEKSQDSFSGQDIELEYSTFESLAVSYHAVERYADAILPNLRCIEISRELGWTHQLGLALYHLGREQCILRNYSEAKDALLENLTLITRYNIQEGAKRVNYEWLVVALWYLGEYERAIEYRMDYINFCKKDGVPPKSHAITLESNLLPNTKVADLSQKGGHLLVLPSPYNLSYIEKWDRKIVKRRPELSDFSLLSFQKPDNKSNLPAATDYKKRLGRNDLCYCGSGKKYKHCHLRKSK